MKETPQKEHSLANRRSKDSQVKKPLKVTNKSLNGAFTSVSEDVSSEISKDSSDFSPISEISDSNNSQISECFVAASNPTLSTSSETFPLSVDLTPTSKITTVTCEPGDVSVESFGFNKPDGSQNCLVEADIVANLLQQARTQILHSADADHLSKRLLNALIKVVIDDFYALPGEKDWITEFVSLKGHIVFLCFLLWTFAVSAIFFFSLQFHGSYGGPPPT